ncbi:MAG: class I SAM-dependent methyltransferase [Caldilineaceae bacterium]
MREDSLLPLLYDSASTTGWHGGMVAVTQALLHKVPLPIAPAILEVGCGGGDVLRLLARQFPDAQIVGLDLNDLAVETAQRTSGAQVAQANLLRLPFASRTFGLLLALDSLDQREVPLGAALAEVWRVLEPGGLLLLRVSAYPWLYGAHDRAFNTGRRYTGRELRAALKAQGFALVRGTHANTLLAPPVMAQRLLERLRGASRPSATDVAIYSTPLANHTVHLALQSEAIWLRRASLPAGLSLIAVARKVSA